MVTGVRQVSHEKSNPMGTECIVSRWPGQPLKAVGNLACAEAAYRRRMEASYRSAAFCLQRQEPPEGGPEPAAQETWEITHLHDTAFHWECQRACAPG